MPELPEVECLARAVGKVVKGSTVSSIEFFRKDLREVIPVKEIRTVLLGQEVLRVFRRSKYILIEVERGFGVIHLGMTGNFVTRSQSQPVFNHTHAVFGFTSARGGVEYLHYIDPRRFGRISAIAGPTFATHAFFAELGPEPLKHKDLGGHLFERSRRRSQPIKTFLMDPRNVVGVGNIYASESLFRARLNPLAPAGQINLEDFCRLADCVRTTLREAIKAGGTTFRDFRNADGNPGYFRIMLAVYGRESEPCVVCGAKIVETRLGGRSTFHCPICQK